MPSANSLSSWKSGPAAAARSFFMNVGASIGRSRRRPEGQRGPIRINHPLLWQLKARFFSPDLSDSANSSWNMWSRQNTKLTEVPVQQADDLHCQGRKYLHGVRRPEAYDSDRVYPAHRPPQSRGRHKHHREHGRSPSGDRRRAVSRMCLSACSCRALQDTESDLCCCRYAQLHEL